MHALQQNLRSKPNTMPTMSYNTQHHHLPLRRPRTNPTNHTKNDIHNPKEEKIKWDSPTKSTITKKSDNKSYDTSGHEALNTNETSASKQDKYPSPATQP
jgi:hypothetical protein